jgi:hypothetical protein
VDEIKQEKESLLQAAEQGKQDLAALKSDRETVAAAIDARLLEIFKYQLRKHSDGIAIAEVKKEVCQGCNMNIPPQMYNDLQKTTSFQYCPSCERIIFWQDENERSE